MSPFSSMTLYPSVPFSRYLVLKNFMTMKSRLGVTHSANLRTIAEIYIQTRRYLFAADSMGLPFPYTQRPPDIWRCAYLWSFSYSRSLNSVPIGEARMRLTFIVNRCNSVYACLLSFLKYNNLWVQNLHFCRFHPLQSRLNLKPSKEGSPGIYDNLYIKVESW